MFPFYQRSRFVINGSIELEATNLALQNRLDIIDRKAQISETTLNKLTRERDMAVSQLGVAYLETQDYKNENESFKRENAELKSQLSRFASSTQKSRESTGRSEQTFASDEEDGEDSQIHTQRSDNVNRNTRDLTSKSNRSRSKPARDEDTRTKVSNQVDKEILRLEKERADEALFSIDVPRSRPSKKSENRQAESTGSKKPNTGKQRVKRVVVEEVDVTDPVDSGAEEVTKHTRKFSQGEQDLSLLSFVDVSLLYLFFLLSAPLTSSHRNVKSRSCERHWKKSDWLVNSGWRILRKNLLSTKLRTPPARAIRSLRRESRL